MGMNFNIVKKPKKNDDEDEEVKDEDELEFEEVEEEETNSKSSTFDPKKKMLRLMCIIAIGTVGLLLLLFMISTVLSGKSKYTYSEIENTMKKAAISYFKDHPDYLPKEDGNIVEVDASNLAAEGKMDDLSEYLEDGVSCTGTVQVEKVDSDYLYTPYLNCGESYSTVELYKKIISDNNPVSTGYGLYSNGNTYAFRGEVVNNYVKLDETLWRVVKITSNNEVVLIYTGENSLSTEWDNRYNPDESYASGFNQYSASRIKEYLERIYTNPVEKDNEVILSKNDKAKLVSYNLCVGKRAINSESKDNKEECAQVLKNQKMGLLTLSDYLYASIDPNCKSATSKSCQNYNYLVIKDDWWLLTGDKANSSGVFQVSSKGFVSSSTAGSYGDVRPVIYLNSKVLYKSGNGTLEKPYKVR